MTKFSSKRRDDTYVVVGSTGAKSGKVFQRLQLPGKSMTWVMNERVFRRAVDEADRTLREVIAEQRAKHGRG